MCSTKLYLAMIFNEIKCHVNTFLGLVGGDASLASPPVSAPERRIYTNQDFLPWL